MPSRLVPLLGLPQPLPVALKVILGGLMPRAGLSGLFRRAHRALVALPATPIGLVLLHNSPLRLPPSCCAAAPPASA